MRFANPLGPTEVLTVGGTERIVVSQSLTFAAAVPQTIPIPLQPTDASLCIYVVNASNPYGFQPTVVGASTGNGYQTGLEDLAGPNVNLGAVTIANVYGAADPTVNLTLTPEPAETVFPVTVTLVVVALPTDQFIGNRFRPLIVDQVPLSVQGLYVAGLGNYGPATIMPASPTTPLFELYSFSCSSNQGAAPLARVFLSVAGSTVWSGMAGAPVGGLGPMQFYIGAADLKLQVFAGGAETWGVTFGYTLAAS